jgi:Neocarzinostatin family
MLGRGGVFAAVILSVLAASCGGRSSAPAAGTGANTATSVSPATSPSASTAAGTKPETCTPSGVPGLACSHPTVTVTPSGGLRAGQRVTVRVTGFAEGKVFLSECAASTDVNPAGCGPQLAAQPFLVTGNNRAASGTYTVSSRASPRAYSSAQTLRCADRCVIVATSGLGLARDYAYAPIAFAG